VAIGFTPLRPPDPPTPRVEILWAVRKGDREARALVRQHPLGRELVVMVGQDIGWSRVYRRGVGSYVRCCFCLCALPSRSGDVEPAEPHRVVGAIPSQDAADDLLLVARHDLFVEAIEMNSHRVPVVFERL
jgi:hypothetical protein